MRTGTIAGIVIVAIFVWATSASGALVVAHFPFDSGFDDDSGNGHNGTATNASLVTVNTTTPRFGAGAANFANSVATDNGYITLGSNIIQFATNTAYAISFWAKPTDSSATNNGGMIVGDPATNASFVWVEESAASGGGLRLRSVPGSPNQADFPISNFAATIKDGAFHHFVVMVSDLDGDGNKNDASLYVDGVLKTPVKNVANTSLDIKAIGQAYTTAAFSFKGQMDELWIFSGTLTSGEVASLYASNTVPEPGFVTGVIGIALLALRRCGRRR